MTTSLQLTPFCPRLGLTAPVMQAPVGGATTPELAAAVWKPGGLGMLALSCLTSRSGGASKATAR